MSADWVPLKRIASLNPETLGDHTGPGTEFRYIDISATGRGRLVGDPEPMTFESAPSRARRVLRQGDTILSTVRTYLRAVWTLRDPEPDLVASTGFVCLRPRPGVDPRYLGWLTQSNLVVEEVVARSVGVSYPAINPSDVGLIKVPLPAIGEQRAIADFLDRETTRIDALIAAKQRMLSLLDEREYSLLSRLTVPDGCSYVHLRYLAGLQSGVTVDSKRDAGADAVTRPYLRVANVQAGHLNLDEVTMITVPAATAVRATLRDGDVVMTEGGDIDKLGRGTIWRNQIEGCLHQNHIFALRPNPRLLDADFLALLSRSAHARTYFESTGVQSTNLASTSSAKILSLPVPALPLETQRNIVASWRHAANRAGALNESMRAQITLLKERRQALIAAAVMGQVEVPLAT